MLKNYIRTLFRNLKRNALFSAINIAGLAISMSVGVLVIILFSELQSFDDFHANKDKIYRVHSTQNVRGSDVHYSTSSIYIGNQIESQVPGVEKVLIMRQLRAQPVLQNAERAIPVQGFYASESFFDVFSFKLKKGNPQTSLTEPNSIVLTESASEKLFGDEDPLGKVLTVQGYKDVESVMVTGVVEDPPINSHIRFEALYSLKTIEQQIASLRNNFHDRPWDVSYNYVYVVLQEGVDKKDIEATLTKIMADYNSTTTGPTSHSLQSLKSLVTDNIYSNSSGATISNIKVRVIVGLTIIVLLSACFNYTNLSLARALRRSKEVSIRKAIGANRLQIFTQFLLEAVLFSMIALVIGFGFFALIRPEFLSLPGSTSQGYQIFTLNIHYSYLFYFLFFAIVVGCCAGLLPALFLSKLKTNTVLKGATEIRLFTGVNLRRFLITFQFAMSVGLIMCALLVYKQYKFALNYDLGFKTENIVNIRIRGDYINVLEKEYERLSGIQGTSKSHIPMGVRYGMIGFSISEDKMDSVFHLFNEIDEKYLDMHQYQFLAGRGFSKSLKENETSRYVVVNESFLKELKLGSPESAIGKNIWRNGARYEILGVVKDFIHSDLTAVPHNSFAFFQPSSADSYQFLGVKIASNDLLSTMEKLEATYQELDAAYPFDGVFYEDQIARIYEQHLATYKIVTFLAFLAITISTLGLLGMAVFTKESRLKEVSIRKVLGASTGNIMLLLSRGFLLLIAIAGLCAIPVTLYIVDSMILNELAHRVNIGLLEILSGFSIVLLIGTLTVFWQTHEAAVQNPINTLRTE